MRWICSQRIRSASSVSAWCRIDCRIALYPGVSADEARPEIEQAIDAFAREDSYFANRRPRVVFNDFFSGGCVLAPGSGAELALERAHRLATGETLRSAMSAASLDAR